MVNKLENYAGIVRLMLDNSGKSDEESIDECIGNIKQIYPQLTSADLEAIKKRVLSTFSHHLDMGTMITDSSQDPWFMGRTKDCEMFYSERNRQYLIQYRNLSPDVVSKLDSITDTIMDGFGNPMKESFARRGLVMGDVQSGKTNTYTRLCCKAVDVGYRMIILLTGTLESLRRQTQGRMDEGLVGKDSAVFIKKKATEPIGVGKINAERDDFAVFTHTESDFKERNAESLNIPITDLKTPVLLVIKKNAKIINNLATWLETHKNGMIKSPLLLIDDEADNASINTSDADVTAINNGIRKILSMFQKNTYVGFTATPYANIFINPDDDKDLYPKHFIYCLKSPSNYVGPRSVYQEDGTHHFMLKTIYLDEDYYRTGLPELPYKHQKDYEMRSIPDSMREAINCFVVSCAIRDLRGMTNAHMSMLINASRFTAVQESIKDIVEQRMFQIKTAVEVNSKLPVDEALSDPLIDDLYSAWKNNYDNLEFTWEQVQNALSAAAKPITVRSVNQRTGAKTLNYDEYKKDGLRVIAIGGNSLSRGLTLEGLCISYFYRRAQSYDTLMQMGRWFGYRDDYSDLCRIWMTEESIEWYDRISFATEELKREFEIMFALGKTPEIFGMRVRNDITGMLVTARNKMRNAGDKLIIKSLDGTPVWTSSISAGNEKIEHNEQLTINLIRKLKKIKNPIHNNITGNKVFPDVSFEFVKEFLKSYQYPEAENRLFNRDAILDMINEGTLATNWDIAIQHGSGDIYARLSKEGIEVKKSRRTSYKVRGKTEEDLNIRFNSAALLTPFSMAEGIYNDYPADESNMNVDDGPFDGSRDRIEKLESDYLDNLRKAGEKDIPENPPMKAYLSTSKRRPLMLIIPLQLGINTGSSNKNENDAERIKEHQKKLLDRLGSNSVPIGVALGFPVSDNNESNHLIIKYKTTRVYDKNGGNEDLDEDDDDG